MIEHEQYIVEDNSVGSGEKEPVFSLPKFNRICEKAMTVFDEDKILADVTDDSSPEKISVYQQVKRNLKLIGRGLEGDDTFDQAIKVLSNFVLYSKGDDTDQDRATDIIVRHWHSICEKVDPDNLFQSLFILKAAYSVAQNGKRRKSPELEQEGKKIINQHGDVITQAVYDLEEVGEQLSMHRDFVPVLELFLDNPRNYRSMDQMSGIIAENILNNNPINNSSEPSSYQQLNLLKVLFDSDQDGSKQFAIQCLKAVLDEYGINYQKAMVHWLFSDFKEKSRGSLYIDNLAKMILLERCRPGAARILNSEFGIYDFDRYELGLLLDQFDKRDQDIPYGVMIFPKGDNNGAFYCTNYTLKMREDLSRLGYGLRVVECESRIDVVKRLIQLNRRYGEKNKISFAIIGGHGTYKNIQFGVGVNNSDFITADDLWEKGAQRTGGFFTSNPTIILKSCSTGLRQGIGHQLSYVFDCRVIAPDSLTNISAIRVATDDQGKLDFNVTYVKEKSMQSFTSGEK